jgi:hypothetical protein
MNELAKLLGTTENRLKLLDDQMGAFTGKKGVPQELLGEMARERGEALSQLGLSESSRRAEILAALLERVEKTEEELLELFQDPDCSTQEGCQVPIKNAFSLSRKGGRPLKGFFLRESKAKELFLAHPPKGIMSEFGYDPAKGGKGVEKMLEEMDIYHLFASVRFLEEPRWLNEEFFASYSNLTPDDFEEREIKIRILPKEQFESIGAEFMRKKFHNVSHLKEMGLIFVLPVAQEEGVFLRMFSLLLHYIHEVGFYADHFRAIAADKEEPFAERLTSALRGDVRETVPPIENLLVWLIIQRYLAKDDSSDPRLASPHVSSEALFWRKATDVLGRLGEENPDLGLSFWAGNAHVSGVLSAQGGSASGRDGEVISFNFEDNVFSAAAGEDPSFAEASEAGQYTYHMREALWNRLFVEYFDEKTLETLIAEDFGQGFIGFKIRASNSA